MLAFHAHDEQAAATHLHLLLSFHLACQVPHLIVLRSFVDIVGTLTKDFLAFCRQALGRKTMFICQELSQLGEQFSVSFFSFFYALTLFLNRTAATEKAAIKFRIQIRSLCRSNLA